MRVKPRGWLGGAVREQRGMLLIRRRRERGRRSVAHRPRWACPDGLVVSPRARWAPWRAPGHTGPGGQPRRRPWPTVLLAHVGEGYEQCRFGATARRWQGAREERGRGVASGTRRS